MNFAKYRVQLSTEKKSTRVSTSTSTSTPSLMGRIFFKGYLLNLLFFLLYLECLGDGIFLKMSLSLDQRTHKYTM